MTSVEKHPGDTGSPEDLSALRERARELIDHAQIVELINRFARELDERVRHPGRFDEEWARLFFTEDAAVDYPVGSYAGVAAIAKGVRQAMGKFLRTQHLHANHLVDVDGDNAVVRWDLVATHVLRESSPESGGEGVGPLFRVGDYYEGEAVRTARGWRFRSMTLHVVWMTGTPPPRD
jgi:hypothetical protein